jgi:hypothetical protein
MLLFIQFNKFQQSEVCNNLCLEGGKAQGEFISIRKIRLDWKSNHEALAEPFVSGSIPVLDQLFLMAIHFVVEVVNCSRNSIFKAQETS